MAILDTNVLIDLMRRPSKRDAAQATLLLQRLLAAGERLATTRFNVAELWVGVERSQHPGREQAALETMLADLAILEFDAASARWFGRLTAYLYQLGRSTSDMDVLIASVAMATRQALVTRNPRHFADIPDLAVHAY